MAGGRCALASHHGAALGRGKSYSTNIRGQDKVRRLLSNPVQRFGDPALTSGLKKSGKDTLKDTVHLPPGRFEAMALGEPNQEVPYWYLSHTD